MLSVCMFTFSYLLFNKMVFVVKINEAILKNKKHYTQNVFKNTIELFIYNLPIGSQFFVCPKKECNLFKYIYCTHQICFNSEKRFTQFLRRPVVSHLFVFIVVTLAEGTGSPPRRPGFEYWVNLRSFITRSGHCHS